MRMECDKAFLFLKQYSDNRTNLELMEIVLVPINYITA